MTRLKLRTFSIALVLVGATLGMALNFSETVVTGNGQTFSEENELSQLRSDFQNQSSTVTAQKTEAESVGIQTDFFFLAEIWNVITTVVQGLGSTLTLINSAAGLTGLAIPDSVMALASVITIGVIFAVVSAARGWDV